MLAPAHHLYADGAHYDRAFGDNAYARDPELGFYQQLATPLDASSFQACRCLRPCAPGSHL